MDSSPGRHRRGIVCALLRVCCGLESALSWKIRSEPQARDRCRANLVARLPMGTRKMFSFGNRPQECGWTIESDLAESRGFSPTDYSNRRPIHWVLQRNRFRCDFSSGDVFVGVLWTSSFGSKTRGYSRRTSQIEGD